LDSTLVGKEPRLDFIIKDLPSVLILVNADQF